MLIDLHCHSTHSDGSEAPESVAARAARRGVELFCLTDHDSCAGYGATLGACRHVIRGLELSCTDEELRTVHILLYDTARDAERWAELEERLIRLRQIRQQRLRAITGRLHELGIAVDIDWILAQAGGRSVGRPDIAHALVRAGVVSSINEAFRKYLSDGNVADVPFERVSVAQGLELGARAGAKMALAHPHTLGARTEAFVQRYRDHGLEGLECYYSSYSSRQRKRWLALAKRLNLTVTGGSDFHGTVLPQVTEPGIELPPVHAEKLGAWLAL